MPTLKELFARAIEDPAFEAEHISKRPLRGPQSEAIKRIEAHVRRKEGSVMCIRSSRQSGKNEMSAILQMRHLILNQHASQKSSWIRTAPTFLPQVVNSKKRLEEIMRVDRKNVARHPMFLGQKIQKSEGFIWKHGNATVEFLSSGTHSNVVGGTASACLDMDEAHKVSKNKLDEDFMPFTASTNAPTLLWGVAADGLDALESYRQLNIEMGRADLNLDYPCEFWMESPAYRGHIETRIQALGWDHPIIKTQYRLIPVANEGTFINKAQAAALFDSDHDRQLSPRPNTKYEILIDLAAGNEDFNPDKNFVGEGDGDTTSTDSTVVWVYEVTDQICQNNIFPVVRLVNMYHWTGVPLPQQEIQIKQLIVQWHASKVTVDSVGVGRQIGEALEQAFGVHMVNKYVASSVSVSEDCFDLLARLNYSAVKMFRNDESSEWLEFERQVGWTKYASSQGKMSLSKPNSDKHIDMVKALTYFRQNNPDSTMHTILSVEGDYE